MASAGARDGGRRGLVAGGGTLVLCLLSTLGFIGDWHWTLDLLSHFRPHYAVLLAAGALLCAWRGAVLAAVLAAGCAALQLGTLLPYWLPPAAAPAKTGTPLRVLLANVHTGNRDYAAVRALLRRETPDVAVLEETDRQWVDALEETAAAWPHRVVEPRADNFGIAVWSQKPLREVRIVRFGRAGVPSVVADLEHEGATFTLVATHALPPVGAVRTALRDEALAAVASFARAQPTPVLVVGDLNCSPWSPRFRRLLAEGRLRDSGEGRGLQPTWPSPLSAVGIPIDHCLYGDGLRVVDRRVGPHVGSDHRPLVVDVAVVKAE